MRVAMVRTDLDRIYLSDLENSSQRNFSSEPVGQSRYVHRLTAAEITTLLSANAPLTLLGSVGAATFDTSVNDTLEIGTAAGVFTAISVTSGAATPIATIVADLNAGFLANNLPFVAEASTDAGTLNQVRINTTTLGPSATLYTDTFAGGSTLNTPLGLTDGASLTGLTAAAFAAAVYTGALPNQDVDITDATLQGLSTFDDLEDADEAVLLLAIRDAVAPRIVETGQALLSFAYGVTGKLTDVTLQPGGTRAGYAAGRAAVVKLDDGSANFTI